MTASSDRKTLLIVDDVEFFAQSLISMLDRQRYNIYTAGSGREALEKAAAIKPDLILLDHQMEDMNGEEVCLALKAARKTSCTPVILVSSGSRERSRGQAINAGCDGLLFKPVRRDALLSVLDVLLHDPRQRAERARVDLACTLTLEDSDFPSSIRSISANGALLETDQRFIRGEVVGLDFRIPGHSSKTRIRSAVVSWWGTRNGNATTLARVRFLPPDRELGERLQTLAL